MNVFDRAYSNGSKSLVVSLATLMAGLALAAPASAQIYQNPEAQDSPAAAPSDTPSPRVVKKPPPKPARKKAAESEAAKPVPVKPAADKPTPVPATSPPAAAQQGKPTGPDIAAKLKQNGAGTCAPQVNALATQVMGNVASFNTMSDWAKAAGDKRLVSVTIGQKYPPGLLPYGATSIIASPNPMGSCDAVAVQVLPSALPCDKLRETIATHGKAMGALVDIAVMQDGTGDTLLIPTAAKTCVMVVLKTSFPNDPVPK